MKKKSSLPGLGILAALLPLGLIVPSAARANSGVNFLETIGVSTAVGTVLGASTLPFYDEPGTHLSNIAAGAALGAAVGLGVCIAGWISGTPKDQFEEANDSGPARELRKGPRPFAVRYNSGSKAQIPLPPPALVWTPLVSLHW